MANDALKDLSKEQLLELIDLYSKNWLALDGVWFQSVENRLGMEEAMFHDREAWRRYTVIEARRIKTFLGLPEHAGLEGLALALAFRFYGNLNRQETVFDGNRMLYRNLDCRVQTARKRKGLPFHPCKSVGIIEYSEFAQVLDNRIRCRRISCYSDAVDSVGCAWEFTLEDEE